jgi:hypothetical protein
MANSQEDDVTLPGRKMKTGSLLWEFLRKDNEAMDHAARVFFRAHSCTIYTVGPEAGSHRNRLIYCKFTSIPIWSIIELETRVKEKWIMNGVSEKDAL